MNLSRDGEKHTNTLKLNVGEYMDICFDYEPENSAMFLLLTMTISSWVTL